MKDHYKALHVSASASADEIRKAFRRLALLYHPDKNKAVSAPDHFAEIKEAYEVLKDPVKRADYNYRRYTSGAAFAEKPRAQNAADILHAAGTLARNVSRIDPFRINLDTVSFGIRDILSPYNISLLQQAGDPVINLKIARHLLEALKLLPLPVAAGCMAPLRTLAADDPVLQKELDTFLGNARRQYYWNRYKIYIALLLAVLFIIVLSLSGK